MEINDFENACVCMYVCADFEPKLSVDFYKQWSMYAKQYKNIFP